MAIVDYEDQPEKIPHPVDIVHEPQVHESTLIDTAFTPRSNIITQVQGAPWKVAFYSQVLGKDSALYGHSPTKDTLNQSYIKTMDLVLRVTSALSTSQDDKTNAFIVEGTAVAMPYLRPNQGDMFVADIGDGRKGIFRIQRTNQKSFYKESVTEIDYVLVSYTDGSGDTRYKDLESKVIETRYYVEDYIKYNQNPYATEERYHTHALLKERYQELLDHYLRYYYSERFKTLLIPYQQTFTYDPFLVRFFHRAFDVHQNPRASGIKVFNVSDIYRYQALSIWDVLLERDRDMLPDIFSRYTLIGVNTFTTTPMLEGIRYSGMQDVIYPVNPRLTVDMTTQDNSQLLRERLLLDDSPDTRAYLQYQHTPLIHPVCKCSHYVFSPHFYAKDKHMSWLEAQTHLYIENQPINHDVLKALLDDYQHWGSVERFYYTPVLLLLMYSVIRGI